MVLSWETDQLAWRDVIEDGRQGLPKEGHCSEQCVMSLRRYRKSPNGLLARRLESPELKDNPFVFGIQLLRGE
jgi:hypothetical protein